MDPSLLTIILLGIVEGVTEFIPVSSTGHLVLAAELLGFRSAAEGTFEIVIQLGAILAVILLYWRRFWEVLVGLLRWSSGPVAFTRNVLLGFLPSMAIGALAYGAIRRMLETPEIVAVALIAGGIAILVIERMTKRVTTESVEAMGWKTALGIGVIQCLSMIPGVSRSGATIMGALAFGVERKTAAEFSFFVAVPTMIGASAYALFKSGAQLGAGELSDIAIGFVVSFLVALAVIKAFIGIVTRYGFAPFAWYRIVVGSVALVWLLAR
ncbi:MAG: undecaprenyl-diphosphatase [Sphingomonadales bacterium]|jgi:undecaprenyl-diphosphatase|nr:undecaprenyl-diphosphatase [Sphingomonadales bacterium]